MYRTSSAILFNSSACKLIVSTYLKEEFIDYSTTKFIVRVYFSFSIGQKFRGIIPDF